MVTALVAAFPGYVADRLAGLGVVRDEELDTAVARATSWLEAELRLLLARPGIEQTESPLEVVRRATAPVTALLAAQRRCAGGA